MARRIHERASRINSFDFDPLERLEGLRSVISGRVLSGDIEAVMDETVGDADPAAAAPYWAVHLLIGDVSPSSLDRFLAFYEQYGADSFVEYFMAGAYDATGILDYVRAYWRAYHASGNKAVRAVLHEFGGFEGYRRWLSLQRAVDEAQFSLPPRERRKTMQSSHELLGIPRVQEVLKNFMATFDEDLLDVLLSTRSNRRFSARQSAELNEIVSSITKSPVLTFVKRTYVSALRNYERADMQSTNALGVVFRHLAGLEHERGNDRTIELLVSVLSYGIKSGSLGTVDIRDQLEGIDAAAQRPDAVLYLWNPSPRIYSTLVPIAAEPLGSPSRRGAALMLIAAGLGREGASTSYPPPVVRFSGFARMQAEMSASDDSLVRAAAISTFFARRPTSRQAQADLRILIEGCSSRLEERLIMSLCDYSIQFSDQVQPWTKLIESLLSVDLYGDINPFLVERLSQLIESEDQSLGHLEAQLNLPLPVHD
jgi:hypothetical protein